MPTTFVAQAPPENGDGAAFRSSDQRAQVAAYGENNVPAVTAAAALRECESQRTSEGSRVTYSFVEQDRFICSGYQQDGSIFYERTVVYSSVRYSVVWTYPRDLKMYLDPPLQHSVATFRPGPNRSA